MAPLRRRSVVSVGSLCREYCQPELTERMRIDRCAVADRQGQCGVICHLVLLFKVPWWPAASVCDWGTQLTYMRARAFSAATLQARLSTLHPKCWKTTTTTVL